MERATEALNRENKELNAEWYQYLSPLGWEHINLTGDYIWHEDKKVQQGKFRSLRTEKNP